MKTYLRITNALVLFGCLGSIQYANATIIDHGSYLSDTATGLDWLDVTETLNISYDDILIELASGGSLDGWELATTEQFNTLLVNATGLATTEITNPYNYVLNDSGDTTTSERVTKYIVELLGNAAPDNSTRVDGYEVYNTQGWLAFPQDRSVVNFPGYLTDGKAVRAIIFDYVHYSATFTSGITYSYIDGYAADYPGNNRGSDDTYVDTNFVHPSIGSFLVRQTQSTVPTPSPLVLLSIGLVPLFLTRRDMQK